MFKGLSTLNRRREISPKPQMPTTLSRRFPMEKRSCQFMACLCPTEALPKKLRLWSRVIRSDHSATAAAITQLAEKILPP